MKRRHLLALSGSAIAVTARADQSLPFVNFVTLRSADANSDLLAAFLRGLSDLGFRENVNLAIAYGFADGSGDKLRSLVADLVARRVLARADEVIE